MPQHLWPQHVLRSDDAVREFFARIRAAWRKSRKTGGAYSVYGADGNGRTLFEIRVHVQAALVAPAGRDADLPLLAKGGAK